MSVFLSHTSKCPDGILVQLYPSDIPVLDKMRDDIPFLIPICPVPGIVRPVLGTVSIIGTSILISIVLVVHSFVLCLRTIEDPLVRFSFCVPATAAVPRLKSIPYAVEDLSIVLGRIRHFKKPSQHASGRTRLTLKIR